MQIAKNKVVSLVYQLSESGPEGQIIEKVESLNPFSFIYGTGMLLPKFEENLVGLEKGSKFSFLLESKDAYGEMTDDAVIEIPVSAFEVDGKIQEGLLSIGNIIPMQDEQGRPLDGKIVSVGLESVKMDFNHPLAGVNLYFTGEVIEIRDASEEELNHGHVHSHNNHHNN